MAKRSSSSRWKQRQARDPFVRRAHAEGWRSRAVFKLAEILDRERMLRPGVVVVDLGAAPGAWSQYVAPLVAPGGRVLALDVLQLDQLPGVEVIQGDFRDEDTVARLRNALSGASVDLVLSDMAPNMSGTRSVDQPRSMLLAELALDFACEVLRPGGSIVAKVFQGEGFQEFVASARPRFDTVRLRKPAASRSGNRETYLVARNFRV
jgi:23S rRNA (uridine2552-2'-O)-methyltransferase